MLIVSVIWGFASPVVKFALNWFHPFVFLAYRLAISSIFAFFYFVYFKIPFPKKTQDLGLVFLTGLISAPISLGLFFYAMSKTDALMGSMITTIGPLILVLAGALFFREKISKNEGFGIIIALIGTLIIAIGPLFGNGHPASFGAFEGNLIMLLATITDIVAIVLTKIALKRRVSVSFIAQSQFILGFIVLLPVVFYNHTFTEIVMNLANAPLSAHLAVFFMALASGTLAYTLRNVAANWIEVGEAAIFNYLQPIFAAILAILWLKETVTPSYTIGGMIILVGVMLAEYKKKRLKHLKLRRQRQ